MKIEELKRNLIFENNKIPGNEFNNEIQEWNSRMYNGNIIFNDHQTFYIMVFIITDLKLSFPLFEE